MKKSFHLLFFLPLIFLVMSLKGISLKDEEETNKRGAIDKSDLPDILFNSVKMNDFDMLLNYIPNENEIEYLKTHSAKKNKYLFEGINADELKINTKVNFNKLIEQGIEKEINWSDSELVDSRIEEGNFSDKRIHKGIFSIQDAKGKSMQASFDIIKIKNKWFIFQGDKSRPIKKTLRIGRVFLFKMIYGFFMLPVFLNPYPSRQWSLSFPYQPGYFSFCNNP
jgi:hypothetical protein